MASPSELRIGRTSSRVPSRSRSSASSSAGYFPELGGGPALTSSDTAPMLCASDALRLAVDAGRSVPVGRGLAVP